MTPVAHPPRPWRIPVRGVTYSGRCWGPSQGPRVVLLHGFTGSSASWEGVAPALAQAGYRVWAPDLLGHGHTDAPDDPQRYTMAQVAADLVALFQHRELSLEGQPLHLLGYSMGGRLALYLALDHPEWIHSLVLESASPGLDDPIQRGARRRQDEALAARILAQGIPSFVEAWERLPLWASQARLSPEVRRRLRQQRLQNRPQGLANSLRGMGTGAQPSLWPRLAELQMPVLLLVGAEDAKYVALGRRMAACIPSARLRVVPQAGHTVHLEQPEAFIRHLLDFWDAPPARRSRGPAPL